MPATLVDTNVLLPLNQPFHPHYSTASTAVNRLQDQATDLCVAPQNLVEYWVVSTRPLAQNGRGMTPLSVAAELRALAGIARLLEGATGVAAAWERLAITHSVAGKKAHDAHLVAVMQVYGVTDILTFNAADFLRYPGIRVLDPAQI